MDSAFKDRVVRVVKMIPSGFVASYGQIATYVGIPRAARQVGSILNQNRDQLTPWWRVVNNQGRISIKGSEFSSQDQKEKLENEGICIAEDLTFDIEKYRFFPNDEFLKKLKLDELYLQMIKHKVKLSKPHFRKI